MSLQPHIFIHVPYIRVVVYLFTIAFHSFLLIEAALKGKEILVPLLLIPIVAVSWGLYRYAKRTVIKLVLADKEIKISTFLGTKIYSNEDVKLHEVNNRFRLEAEQTVYNLQPLLGKGRADEILKLLK